MGLEEKETGTDPQQNHAPHSGGLANLPILHATIDKTEPCCVTVAANTDNISHSITRGPNGTGLHRHPEKITMEILYDGPSEVMSGNCAANTGVLPLL